MNQVRSSPRRAPWSVPRRQPPVHSPVSAASLFHALGRGLGLARDPRDELRAILVSCYTAERVILCGSGTQALQLALGLAGQLAGRRHVALPAFGCFDIATAAVATDFEVSLYDIDPSSLGPDFDSLLRALGEGARVVVAAPLYGIPVRWDELESAAERHGAILVEDAAQGHAARWQGRRLGSLGSISVLSFGRGKGWTGGRGGALLLRQTAAETFDATAAFQQRRARLRNELEAWLTAAAGWSLGRPALYWLPVSLPWLGLGETRYREPKPACPLSRTAATLLHGGERRSEAEAERRRANAELFAAALQANPGVSLIRAPPNALPGALRFPALLQGGAAAFGRMDEASRLGLARSYPRTLGELSAIQERLHSRPSCMGADALVSELVTLPTHSLVRSEDRERLLRLLDPSPGL